MNSNTHAYVDSSWNFVHCVFCGEVQSQSTSMKTVIRETLIYVLLLCTM